MTWPLAITLSSLAIALALVVWAYLHYGYLERQGHRRAMDEAEKALSGELAAELEQAKAELDEWQRSVKWIQLPPVDGLVTCARCYQQVGSGHWCVGPVIQRRQRGIEHSTTL